MRTFDDFLKRTLCHTGDDEPAVAQTISNSGPGAFTEPYLKKGFDRAETDVLNRPLQFFPNDTFVPFSSQTEQALTGMEGRALGAHPIIQGAQGQIADTLSGEYLSGGNPAYGAMVDRATRPLIDNFQNNIVPTINGAMSEAGRYGSGIARQGQLDRQADILSRQIGDVSGNLAYQNYGTERGLMNAATQMAPQIEQLGYMPDQTLAQVGGVREGMSQQQLNDEMARFNFAQNEPTQRLAQYQSLIAGGNVGNQTVTTSPVQKGNPWLQGAGLASMGIGAANTLFNPTQGLFPGFSLSGW